MESQYPERTGSRELPYVLVIEYNAETGWFAICEDAGFEIAFDEIDLAHGPVSVSDLAYTELCEFLRARDELDEINVVFRKTEAAEAETERRKQFHGLLFALGEPGLRRELASAAGEWALEPGSKSPAFRRARQRGELRPLSPHELSAYLKAFATAS